MSKHRAQRRRYALWQLRQAWIYYLTNLKLAWFEFKHEVIDIIEALKTK